MQLAAALALLGAMVVMVMPLLRLRSDATIPKPGHDTLLQPLGADGESVPQRFGGGAQILFVDSTPSEAEVEVDGLASGTTPLSTELHCAGTDATVVVKRSGWRTFRTKVKCAEGTITKLDPTLIKR